MRLQRRLKIYLDASVPSAYFDNEKPERQAQTIAFWQMLPSYNVYVSQTLITEIQRTPDKALRNQLLELVKPFEKLPLTEEIERALLIGYKPLEILSPPEL